MEQIPGFEIISELGRGATARVLLAKRLETGEKVAIKVFHPHATQSALLSDRLRRESETVRKLSHPRIVRIKEAALESDPPFLVMDFIEGENLQAFQSRLPYVLPEVSAILIRDILAPLAHAHQRGVIHRDLKPENILLNKEGQLFLSDFGIARNEEATQATQPGGIIGTLDYLSPEQALGDTVTPASDLFSLSAILYFLVTGTKPFTRSTPAATLRAIEKENPEPPQRRNPKLSRELSAIILKGLEKNPSARFTSAEEYSEVLRDYLQSLGLTILFPTFSDWCRHAPDSTLEGLKTSAQSLTAAAEKTLKSRDKEVRAGLSDVITHLSLKAPESPAISRILGEWQKEKRQTTRRKAFYLAASLLLFISFGSAGFWFVKKQQPAPVVAMVVKEVPPPPVVAAPIQAPLSEIIAEKLEQKEIIESIPVTPAQALKNTPPIRTTKKPKVVQAKPQPKPLAPIKVAATPVEPVKPVEQEAEPEPEPVKVEATGVVEFDVTGDVAVFWDGRRVSTDKPLEKQRLGRHFVLLDKPGHPVIRSEVWLKEGEPTVIVAKE